MITYKLNTEVRKIKSRVILVFPDDTERTFDSGVAVADVVFDKRYVITEITAMASTVLLKLMEQSINETSWIEEEAISFF